MELLETIKIRRSIRTYKKQELPQGTIEKMLEAARRRLLLETVQPWAFVVVSSQ